MNNFFDEEAEKDSLLSLPGQDKPVSNTQQLLIEKHNALQSSLRLGCITIDRNNEDYIPFLVVNEILGGFFGSRLMKNIREEKGFTYGIHSSVNSLMDQTYFVISTDVKKECTKETIEEIYKEIEKLKTELISEVELKTVTSYMLGRLMNSLTTPFALMDKFKTIYFSKQKYEYYERYNNIVSNIGPEEVKAIANKYLQPEGFSKVIVGGI